MTDAHCERNAPIPHDAETDLRTLIRRAREGSGEAYASLHTRYRPLLEAAVARLRQEELLQREAEQRKLDEADNRSFVLELAYFTEHLPVALEDRRAFAQQLRADREQFEAERQRRRQQRESAVLITD